MPAGNYPRARATAAVVRYLTLLALLAIPTAGASLVLAVFAPLRYRRVYRRAAGGHVPAVLRGAARSRGAYL